MSRRYGEIAFTPAVSDVQAYYGSQEFFVRQRSRRADAVGPDPMTDREREFLAERDGFYLATLSESGWPYVQFRGGPEGFLRAVDDSTVGWADFRGNQQYISTGNLAGNDRVSLIAVDYVGRRRLKLFGRAEVTTLEQDPELVRSFSEPDYDAVVERAVLVRVEAFDWNCPQHIPSRFSAGEIAPVVTKLQDRIAALQEENAELRRRLR